MYRLRDFELPDLRLFERELPGVADVVRELDGAPAEPCGVVVEDPRDRLCGCLVATRHELVTNTRTVGLGIVRIAHVADTARIGGVHGLLFEMDSAFAARCEGPERAFQAVVARWDERDLWWFRRLRDYEPIAASLTFAGAVAPASAPAGVAIEAVAPAVAAALDFGDVAATGVRRTRDAFDHAARRSGRRALIARRDGVVIAWAIVRDDGVLEDHSIDWRDGALAPAMLAAAAHGHTSLRATRWTDQPAELAALQAAGLRVAGPEHVIAARVSAFGLAPATIAEFASLGETDVGARALPHSTHNDQVLLPPPPGTRSTHGDHRRTHGNHQHQPR